MYALGSTLNAAMQVGLVQAATILGGLPVAELSRTMVPINALHRKDMNSHTLIVKSAQLQGMPPDLPATQDGPRSQKGRRDAFATLVKHLSRSLPEGELCHLTFYAFTCTWSPVPATEKQIEANKEPPPRFELDDHGFVIDPEPFVLNGTWYTKHRRLHVVHLQPHIPLNAEDERSAYATLLLHSYWPRGDYPEEHLLGNCKTAVDRLRQLVDSTDEHDRLPPYTLAMLDKVRHSQAMWNEAGEGKHQPHRSAACVRTYTKRTPTPLRTAMSVRPYAAH